MAVYDVTNRSSFESLTNWMSEVSKCAWKKSGNSPVQGVLVATKCDQNEFAQVSNQEALAFAHQHGLAFFETAAVRDTHMRWDDQNASAVGWNGVMAQPGRGTEQPRALHRRNHNILTVSFPDVCACAVWCLQATGKDVDIPFNFLAAKYSEYYEQKLKDVNDSID